MRDLVVAITGASGAVYALRLIEVLRAAGRTVHLTLSPAAVQVFRHECGVTIDLDHFNPDEFWTATQMAARPESSGEEASSSASRGAATGRLVYYHHRDFSAGIASGSFPTEGMVICPCSMGTLASLANGVSTNLIHRAAEVHIKERRKLIVVPRETPLSGIQLDNMKRLCDAGVVVLPAMPGFYHQPASILDLVDFVVGRICDQLGVERDLIRRWGTA